MGAKELTEGAKALGLVVDIQTTLTRTPMFLNGCYVGYRLSEVRVEAADGSVVFTALSGTEEQAVSDAEEWLERYSRAGGKDGRD